MFMKFLENSLITYSFMSNMFWESNSSLCSYFKMEQSRGSVQTFSIDIGSIFSNGGLSVLWRVFFRHKLSYGSVQSRIRSHTGGEETCDRDSGSCGFVCQYTMFQTDELVVCYKLHQTNITKIYIFEPREKSFVQCKREQKALIVQTNL